MRCIMHRKHWMNSRKHIVYDDVKTHDPEQIARDHINLMIEECESGILDSRFSDIELSSQNFKNTEDKNSYE